MSLYQSILGADYERLPAGQEVPARVSFTRLGDAEVLRRHYGKAVLETVQRPGRGRDAGHLIEQFGPVQLILALHGDEIGLRFEIVGARLFALKHFGVRDETFRA